MPGEFIVGAVVGVAAASPQVRKVIRKGLIYGVGGALIAYDKVAALAHTARQTVTEKTGSPEKATTSEGASATPAASPGAQTVSPEASTPAGTPS